MEDILAGTLAKRQHARVALNPQRRHRFTEAGLHRKIQPCGAVRVLLHVSEYFSIGAEAGGPHSDTGGRPLPSTPYAPQPEPIPLQSDGRIEVDDAPPHANKSHMAVPYHLKGP